MCFFGLVGLHLNLIVASPKSIKQALQLDTLELIDTIHHQALSII